MKRVLIRRIESSSKRLGRHVVHDPQSLDFPAKKARKIISVTHAARGLPLDQGEIGSCTMNASCGAMNSDPYAQRPNAIVFVEADAIAMYHEETTLHPRDGIYPPADPGGSGLWAAKVLKNRGLIKSYSHAFGINHALLALVNAPVIFGIDWYSSFDHPDRNGLVQIGDHTTVQGGHEIVATEIDAPNKLVWFWQSWGKWGFQNSGRFCMSFATLDRLLQSQGDCTQFAL